MKTWIHYISLLPFFLICTVLTFILTVTCSIRPLMASSECRGDDTIVVNKVHGNKKYRIKIYPNATHEVLFFTANGEEDKIYQLFIFDIEGKLVKQTMVRNRQTGFLSRLKTGNYSYEVFSNDERIENGSVVVR